MKRFKKIGLAVLVVLIVIIAVLGYFIYDRLHSKPIKLGKTNGELAFLSDRDGTWDILIQDPSGTIRNLTGGNEGQDFFFNFSFSGKVVYFYSSRTGDITPAQVNADGTDFKTYGFTEAALNAFMSGNLDTDPRWSPDSQRLIWASVRDLDSKLYTSNADGSDVNRLTQSGGTDTAPAWSPDGKKIAYISYRSEKQHVYVLDLETNETTPYSSGDSWDNQPVWSLDGTQILYVSDASDQLTDTKAGQLDLVVVNADGSNAHPLGSDEVFKGDPVYSPDGTQIVYMSNESGMWQLYVMNLDGSNVRRLTNDDKSNYMFPAWRPIPASEEAGQ